MGRVSPSPVLVLTMVLRSTGYLAPHGGIVPGEVELPPGTWCAGGWERAGGTSVGFSVGRRILSRTHVTLGSLRTAGPFL